jgi:hypothetical protein
MVKAWLRRKVDEPETLANYSGPTKCLSPERAKVADELRKGGELWEFSSGPDSWRQLMGWSGLCVVRDGQIVASIVICQS